MQPTASHGESLDEMSVCTAPPRAGLVAPVVALFKKYCCSRFKAAVSPPVNLLVARGSSTGSSNPNCCRVGNSPASAMAGVLIVVGVATHGLTSLSLSTFFLKVEKL